MANIQKYSIIALLLVSMVLMWGCKSDSSFWHTLGVKESSGISIEAEYHQTTVPLLNADQEQIIDFLNSLTIKPNPTSGPFSFSAFSLVFRSETAEKEARIRFFNGIGRPEGEYPLAFEFIDNRIDFEIDGKLYAFESNSGLHLTEEMMIEMFNQGARRQGMPMMWEVDGFSQGIYTQVPYPSDIGAGLTLPLLEFDCQKASWCDILDSCDFVAAVEYVGPVTGTLWGRYYVEGFRIHKVYKNSDNAENKLSEKHIILDDFLFLENVSRIIPKDSPGKNEPVLVKNYPHPCMPDYIAGEIYLVCLTSSHYSQGLIPAIGPARIAVIKEGILFPCYNTELHPFIGLKETELSAYLK